MPKLISKLLTALLQNAWIRQYLAALPSSGILRLDEMPTDKPVMYDANGNRLPTSIEVQTRAGNPIVNEQCWIPGVLQGTPLPGHTLATRLSKSPCPLYNCHGLTFASRRTALGFTDEEVYRILHEDGYMPISPTQAQCGDIILYIGEDGTIDHSGIVTEKLEFGNFRIWSKWGVNGNEFQHMLGACSYETRFIKFYRLEPWKN